ncbi:carbon-nitrogen hydrolase family protein [Candidatus Poribacteria bacterium]|nr:carbon-nitrogen hydrolase family protein [Candidatus Poribacteria bacterium]
MAENQIKIAACQLLTSDDVSANIAKVLQQIEACAEMGIQIAVFPEGCLFGYCCRTDYWERISPQVFKEAEAKIAEAARRHAMAVVVGSAHHDGKNWHNDLAIFDQQGSLKYRYGKTFLAGEKWCINNRGKLPIVQLAGVDCCFIICHDVRYPELVKLPAAMGAQLCIFCSCESGLLSEYKLSAYRAMPISRATENGIYLLMSNTPANPDDIGSPSSSHGNSKIVHPDGNVITEAGFFGDKIVSATIDLSEANGSQAKRTYNEDTILREWFQQGCEFVVKV